MAKRAGVKSTGNASRGGFDGLPGHRAAQLLHGGRDGQVRRHRRGHQDRAPG
ncbi:MAG: hypothetical protein M0C28_47140 [Candidatus Moduliflexus flocculans]|nr:hypothetical protein [Candidatus Moduliflexus flocculans]